MVTLSTVPASVGCTSAALEPGDAEIVTDCCCPITTAVRRLMVCLEDCGLKEEPEGVAIRETGFHVDGLEIIITSSSSSTDVGRDCIQALRKSDEDELWFFFVKDLEVF